MKPADPPDRVTLREVASRAGVSMSTASKALNGRGDVSPATRERLLRIAKSMSFRPNRIALSLASRSTGSIGLLTSELGGRFALPVLTAIEDVGGREDISVLLTNGRGDPIRERHHLQVLQDRQVDGIIVIGPKTNPRPSISALVDLPVAYVYTPSEDPSDMSFVPDDVAGAELATDHLIETGRRRIAYVGGDPDWLASHLRAEGFENALRRAGLRRVGEIRHGEWTQRWGRAAADLLLGSDSGIDAIFCASDVVATGVLDVLHDRGISCPDDIAVAGFDNWEMFAEQSRPRLTSIDMNLDSLGATAAKALLAALDGEARPGLHLEPCRLVIRESTGVRT